MNGGFYAKYFRNRLALGKNFVAFALVSEVTAHRVKKAFGTDSKYAKT